MIISKTKKVRVSDRSSFAWSALRKFQNVDLIAGELMRIHALEPRWKENAKKQARQIRYCMIQAREYFSAAQAVSTATKPNLLYYGTMSLALAEILFKQSGESSLDKAREEHRHHGLSMTIGGIPKSANLSQAASQLRATPLEIEGHRKGTFKLWHQTSREHPLPGINTILFDTGGSTDGFELIFGAIDTEYPDIPKNGITLAECLAGLPFLADHTDVLEIDPPLVRGRCFAQTWPGEQWRRTINFIFHPSPLNAKLFERLMVNPNAVDRIELNEISTGYHLALSADFTVPGFTLPFPPAATMNATEWRMWTNNPPLNEFGYFYVALFLAGNYARYYPDKWLQDVEVSTPLALAIEELCSLAEWRVPWLSLCELGQTLLVIDE